MVGARPQAARRLRSREPDDEDGVGVRTDPPARRQDEERRKREEVAVDDIRLPLEDPTTEVGSVSPMARNATLTMVESRKTIPDPRTTATRVQVRRLTDSA